MTKDSRHLETDAVQQRNAWKTIKPGTKEDGQIARVLLGVALVLGLIAALYPLLVSYIPDKGPVKGQVQLLNEKGAEASTVTFERGWNLTHLVRRHYGRTGPTILDMVLEANPLITDINRIPINQGIVMPPLSRDSFVLSSPDRRYMVHLGTYDHRPSIKIFQEASGLKEKTVEIMVRNISPRERWYRVVAGPFATREEATKTLLALKSRGMSFEFDQ